MRHIKLSQVIDTITVCPYCMNEARNKMGCCGESSCHFETAYVTEDETLLQSETEVIDDESGEVSL